MSRWPDFVTAALLGTERGSLPALPDALRPWVESEKADLPPETQFLTQAGALALWRRAGWNPPRSASPQEPVSEAEGTALLTERSAGHLRAMLAGRWPALLPEWLACVASAGRRIPPELLPALLERAREERALRQGAVAAGGSRAAWLAAQNPAWNFAISESGELWETGTRDQRVTFLRTLRRSAPGEARGKLEAVWKSEPADVRGALLATLAEGLAPDDVPFLEAILDDRSREVRRVAIELQARLAGSPLTARMQARAAGLLTFHPGGLLSRASLEVALPDLPAAAAQRDGLDPKAFGPQKLLGEKAVLLVLVLAAIPLRHWTESFGREPAKLLEVAARNDYARALATGWAWAAIRQRDAAWAEAILDGPVEPHGEFLPAEPLLGFLSETARVDRLIAGLRVGALQRQADFANWTALAAKLATFPGPWPLPLGREVLAALRRAAAAGGLPGPLRSVAEHLLLQLPAALLPDAQSGWPLDQEGIPELVALLNFRHEALSALTHP